MAKSLFESVDEAYASLPQASDTAVSNLRMALQDNLGNWQSNRAAIQQADVELAKNVPTAIVGDTSTLTGSLGNTAVAAGAGLVDTLGTMARSPAILLREDMNVPVEVRAAYERVKAAEETGTQPNEADVALINQPFDPFRPTNTQAMMPEFGNYGQMVSKDILNDNPFSKAAAGIPNTRTYADALGWGSVGKGISDTIGDATDLSKYVNQAPVEAITKQLADAYDSKSPIIEDSIDRFMAGDNKAIGDILTGAASLAGDIAVSALKNPGAALQTIAQNLPQTLTARNPLTAGAFTAGYADRTYNEAIADIEKRLGRPATPEERRNAMQKSVESAAVETISNVAELGVAGGLGSLRKAATDIATDVVESTTKKALKGTGTLLKTAAIEGGEEAIQTSLEKQAAGQEATGQELFVSGGLGAIAGAGMGPSITAIQKAAEVPSKVKQFAEESAQTKEELAKARAPVVEPTKATEVDPIEKARNDELDALLSEAQGDPTKVKGAINQSAAKRRWVETADLTTEENIATAEQYLADLDTTQSKVLQNALVNQNEGNQDQADKFMQAAESIATEMGKIQSVVNRAKGITTNPTEDVAAAQTTSDQQRVFGSHDLDTFQDEDLKTMSGWKGLTTNQKQLVESEIAVRELRNTTDEVSGMFTVGGTSKSTGNFMTGINQYVDTIGSAVKTKNIDVAKQAIGQFNNWVQTQTAKNDLVQEGWNLYTKPNKTADEKARLAEVQGILRTQYNMGNDKLQPIHNGSKKLVQNIATDTQALLNTKTRFDNAFSKITAVAPKQATTDIDLETMQDIPTEQAAPVVEEVTPTQETTTKTLSETKEPVTKQSEAPASEQVDEVRSDIQQPTNEDFTASFATRSTRKFNEQVQQLKNNFTTKASNVFTKFPNLVARNKAGEDILGSLKETAVTEGEQVVWDSFQRFNDFMTPFVEKMFVKASPDDLFAFQDWTQEFINEDGSVHPDVVTAINAGIYTWAVDNARSTLYNDPTTVAAITKLTDSEGNLVSESNDNVTVPNTLQQLIGSKGSTVHTLRADIGEAIVTALGVTTTKNSTANAKANLESSLGTLAVGALLSAKTNKGSPLVTVNSVSTTELDTALLDTGYTHGVKVSLELISFGSKAKPTSLNAAWDSLVSTNKQASGFINDLFKVPRTRPEPSFTKPADFKYGKTIKKGNSLIPQTTIDVLNQVNKQPWAINTSMDYITQYLGDDAIRQMMGYEFNPDRLLTPLRVAAEGQNQQIDRDLEAMREFAVLAQENGDFYLTTEVWRNHRMGITNSINPQASKMHRNWIHNKSWDIEIDISEGADISEFLLSVGAGFEITAEKQSKQDAINEVVSKLASEVTAKAIQGIRDIKSGNDTAQTAQDIIAAVIDGEQGLHTFNVLNTYADYLDAVETGETKFKHSLYREVDGKTNGIAILLSQFPTRERTQLLKQLERVGIYVNGITQTYADWSADKQNIDSYQSLTKTWMEALGTKMNDETNTTLVGLRAITGNFIDPDTGKVLKAGRNAAKPLVMTSGYGAGSSSRFDSFIQSEVIDQFYTKLQDAVDANDQQAIEDLFRSLNQVSGLKFSKRGAGELMDTSIVHPNGKVESLRDFSLTPSELKQLTDNVSNQIRESLDTALDVEYGDMFNARSRFATSANVADVLYSAIFNYEVNKVKEAKYQQALTEGKALEGSKGKNSYMNSTELTIAEMEAIDRKLQNIYPAINTPVNKGDPKSRLPMIDSELVIQSIQDNNPYRVQVNTPAGKVKQAGRKREYSQIGVGAAPIAIHSMDASTMLLTQALHPGILNVHDAKLDGQQTTDNSSETINEKFFEVMRDYSLPDEFVGMFERVIKAIQQNPEYADAIRKGLEPVEVTKKGKTVKEQSDLSKTLNKVLRSKEYAEDTKNMTTAQKIAYVRNDIRKVAGELNAIRKEVYSQVTSMNQYTQGEGTNFNTKSFSRSPEAVSKSINEQATNTPNSVDSLGSHGYNNNSANFKEHLEVTPDNSLEVFDKLGSEGTVRDSDEHTKRLRNNLNDIVNKALGKIQLTIKEATGLTSYGQLSGTDMTLVNAIEGTGSFAQPKLGTLRMSSQEVYVHELVHSITQYGIENNIAARRELKRLWKAGQAAIKDPTNKDLYEENKEMFDRAFNPAINAAGKVDYLHEFVAYGMSHEPMIQLLSSVTAAQLKSDWFEGDTLAAKVHHFFGKLLDFLNGKLLGVKGLTVDAQLNNLVRRLASIDANNRGYVMHLIGKKFVNLDAKMNAYNPKVRDAVNAAIKASRKLGKVRKYVVAPLAPAATILNWDEANPMVKQINTLTKQGVQFLQESEIGFARELAALAYESMGITGKNGALVDIRRQAKATIDRERETVRSAVKQVLLSTFDPTNKMTEAVKTAITYAVVKTDLATLLETSNTVNDAINFLINPAARKQEIKAVTQQIANLTKSNYARMQAENLGYMMATGRSMLELPKLNAYSISKGESNSEANSEVELLVDKLATLYAIEYTNPKHIKAASTIIEHELSRGIDENGIATLLSTLHKMKNDSKENLFNGSKGLMIKGYMSDKYDERVDIKTSSNPQDESLISLGYTLEMSMNQDPAINNGDKTYLYVNRHGGMNSYLAGALSIQSKHRRGTTADLMSNQGLYGTGLANVVNGKSKVDTVAYKLGKFSTKGATEAKAIPVYNADGDVVDFRYMMSDKLKDGLLMRETAFDEVVSITAGSVATKPQVRKSNYAVLEVLKATMDRFYNDNPEDFVTISRTSTNKEYREMWKMLPYETRQDIRSVFGTDSITVRKDSLNVAFGQRKYSITDIWDKIPSKRNLIEQAVYTITTRMFGYKAANKLRAAEEFWVELVKLAKDFIVVKSFVVTLGNTLSNMMLLAVHGVNPLKLLADMSVSYKAAQDYQKGLDTIKQLNVRLANQGISANQRKLYEQQIAKITGDLQANPVRHLVAAGVLQNIEEIDTDEESKLLSMIPGMSVVKEIDTSRVPDWMKMIGRNAVLLRNSETYRFLRDMAQMSDFTAKYTLVEHLTKKKKNPLPMQEAIRQASDLFIDYDLPSGVFTQYLNDIGVLMFNKYLIRVQKHILMTLRKRPIQSLALILGAQLGGFESSIFGSLIGATDPLTRFTTPVELFGALDENMYHQIVSGLF